MITTEDLAGLALPPHIHATLDSDRDAATGQPLLVALVWADRTYRRCPQCGEPVPADPGCPVSLNGGAYRGGRIEEWSQQHGCGQWLAVLWQDCAPGLEAIGTAAAALAARRAESLRTGRNTVTASLEDDLRAALTRLAAPLEEGETAEDRASEVTTGSDVQPGIYLDENSSGQWISWDYDPDDDSEVITVYADDLAGGEPVGLEEIGARLGVTRGTVDKWRTRGLLPEPAWTTGGRPAWPWRVIEDWARSTGRLAAS